MRAMVLRLAVLKELPAAGCSISDQDGSPAGQRGAGQCPFCARSQASEFRLKDFRTLVAWRGAGIAVAWVRGDIAHLAQEAGAGGMRRRRDELAYTSRDLPQELLHDIVTRSRRHSRAPSPDAEGCRSRPTRAGAGPGVAAVG